MTPVKDRQPLTDRSNVTLSAGDDVTQLSVDTIRTDGGTQMRGEYTQEAIDDYVAAWHAGRRLPPITVYYDGQDYWLSDGFHRLEAFKRYAPGEPIAATVQAGTRRDAILHAAGANADHGLRRTTADKRRAIMALLSDPEWAAWSDREIARHCKVDHKTVGAVRKDLETTGEIPQSETRTGADGRAINTTAINAGRITLGQVERQLLRCAESISDAGTRTQMLQDLIDRKAGWGWYGDLVRSYVDAETPDHLLAHAAASVLAKFAPRAKPEPSEPVYSETPEHPETPADLAEAGYVLEAHWSGTYHWKVANPNGPGANYGSLWETVAEAIEEARDYIGRGVVFYGESRAVSSADAVDFPEGYSLVQRPGKGWQWQREIAEGTTLLGDYAKTQAEAVAAANKDWEARQARKAAKEVYTEPEGTPEAPPTYTITLDDEAYKALHSAVRTGGLSVIQIGADVKKRIKRAIEEAQRVE